MRAQLALILGLVAPLSCAPSEGPLVPADESLTAAAYVELGMPRLELDWDRDDRASARSMLRRLAEESRTQLPRLASARSGAVFDKLIYEAFQRRGDFEGQLFDLPVGQVEELGAQELADFVRVDSLEGPYGNPYSRGLVYDRELVAIAVQQLIKARQRHAELRANLAELRSRPTLSNTEEGLAAQYLQLIEMSDRVLVGRLKQLVSFAVADLFTEPARSDATAHLLDLVPRIAPLLSASAQADLRASLEAAASDATAEARLSALSEGGERMPPNKALQLPSAGRGVLGQRRPGARPGSQVGYAIWRRGPVSYPAGQRRSQLSADPLGG